MVALRVYDQAGDPYYIDLYEEETLKLNFSIEDITSTEAKSTFSRTFRVPSTGTNNEFFHNAFLVEGIDFDVTVKVPAEIEVGGAFFRSGHIRLQKIYRNEEKNGLDYELLFLGETRDFASVLGESPLCELDGSSLTHTLSYANVVASWDAYPEGALLTDGLLDGDVLYPLVDHGNTYDSSGVVQEPEIRTVGSKKFTQSTQPLLANRFKPMIRAKKVIDMIFDSTPYTYTSSFFDSPLFHKIYVSAWGNEATIYNQETETQNIFRAETAVNANMPGPSGGYQLAECPVEIYDPGNNYNNTGSSSPQPFAYEIPISGAYTFTGTAFIGTLPDWGTGTSYGRVSIFVNGSAVSFGNWLTFSGISNTTYTGAFTAGDYVQLYIETSPNTDISAYSDAMFRCTSAPGIIEPTFQLDCEYKQIDFLKDILKLFRCVMAPDKDNPTNFIIEPWVDYIASGDILDWSDKVDRTKDFQIEPLFFTQSDRIEFKFAEDEDWVNAYNQNAYKQVYGQLNYDSQNELLKDTREIDVAFSPTPTTQIEGDTNTSSWIIPQIHEHDSEGSVTLHNPIKPNTRILFYNGLQPTSHTWYFSDGTTAYGKSTYPAVNYQEGHPPFALYGLNLNWNRWFAYYGDQVTGWDEYAGQSLFERYWSTYVNSLYNKFARRVTCNVVLNSVDLQDFTFDDVIYIDGVYYRPEKIIDAPIGNKESVRVQLIKLLDYRPTDSGLPDPVDWCYYTAAQVNSTCTALGSTFVTLQAPCNLNLQPGDFVSVVGQTLCYSIIGVSSSPIWDYSVIATFGADCAGCNSSVSTPANIYWARQYAETCDTYLTPWIPVETTGTYSPGDVVGLTLRPGCWEIQGITYQSPLDTIATSYVDCPTCLGTPTTYYYEVEKCDEAVLTIITSSVPYSIGQVLTLNGISGCWFIKNSTTIVGTETVDQLYTDCTDCNRENPVEYVYDATACDLSASTVVSYSSPITIGSGVTLNGISGCWEITSATTGTAFFPVQTVYTDCPTCVTNTGGVTNGIVTETSVQIDDETNQNLIQE